MSSARSAASRRRCPSSPTGPGRSTARTASGREPRAGSRTGETVGYEPVSAAPPTCGRGFVFFLSRPSGSAPLVPARSGGRAWELPFLYMELREVRVDSEKGRRASGRHGSRPRRRWRRTTVRPRAQGDARHHLRELRQGVAGALQARRDPAGLLPRLLPEDVAPTAVGRAGTGATEPLSAAPPTCGRGFVFFLLSRAGTPEASGRLAASDPTGPPTPDGSPPPRGRPGRKGTATTRGSRTAAGSSGCPRGSTSPRCP